MSTDRPSIPESVPSIARAHRRAPTAGPFVLAVVGPAGAGKSTVARALAATPGAVLLDADRLGHEVTDHDPEVRAALAADYGPEVYRADGTLDRARVAERVFREPASLARLNALVHPRILARLRAGIAEAARTGAGLVVIDAALLLDWAFERECDAVLAVLASPERQVERLVARRGWSEDEARRRLAAARSHDSFASLADAVVRNDGAESEAVAFAMRCVESWRAGRAGGGA